MARRLTRKMESDLINRYQKDRDKAALTTLVNANLPYIFRICKKACLQGEDVRDVIQEGVVSFIQAVDRFDSSIGCRLITYAGSHVRYCIERYISRFYHPVEFVSDSILENVLGYSEEPTQYAYCEAGEASKIIDFILSKNILSDIQLCILRERFSEAPKTLSNLAKRLNLSVERVRQIQDGTLRLLREEVEKL